MISPPRVRHALVLVAVAVAACRHGRMGGAPAEPAWRAGLPDCGTAEACVAAGVRHASGDGVPRDVAAAVACWEQACRQGDAAACADAGVLLVRAEGVPADERHGYDLLARSCELGREAACLPVAVARAKGLGGRRDLDAAREIARRRCDASDAASCALLGILQLGGFGGPPDPARAFASLDGACRLGAGNGCGLAADLLQAGVGVPRDAARARAGYERGCELGDGNSCAGLAGLLDATGPAANAARVDEQYQLACDLGWPPACVELARRMWRGTPGEAELGRGLQLLERACDLGDGRSCRLVAVRLEETGRPVDRTRVNALLAKACEARDGDGCNRLGLAHEHGEGVAPDLARANALYEQACGLDDAWACGNLAFDLSEGRGIAKDPARASALNEKACRLGNARGCNALGLALEAGEGVAKDLARANALYEKACGLDDAWGCRGLAGNLWMGEGVAADRERARALFEKGCRLGAADACDVLGHLFAVGDGVAADPARAHALRLEACRLGAPAACERLAWRRDPALRAPSEAVVRSVAAFARKHRARLGEISEDALGRIVEEAVRLPPPRAARSELLRALHEAGWTAGGPVFWRELSADLVEGGALERAAEAATHVTSPHVLAVMRVDARYRPLVAARPDLFDVKAAAARSVAEQRAKMEQEPRLLARVDGLLYRLRDALRHEEALRLADEVLARAAAPELPYDDAAKLLVWIRNSRAATLAELGRFDEAVEEYARAARLPEDGAPNVSQAINLGHLYCELDRPREALAMIEAVTGASPYGRMQVEAVRHEAAVALGDAGAAEDALRYLREHQDDGKHTFNRALVVAGRVDEAARALVERLDDPRWRVEALEEVQEFVVPPLPPRAKAWRARWREVLARPEVRRAIARVGKVERFELSDPHW